MKSKVDGFWGAHVKVSLVMLLAGVAPGVWPGDGHAADATASKIGGAKKGAGQEFFSDPKVRLFQFEISPSGVAALRRMPRAYVSGTVREGNRVLTNVAIRLKGMGSFRTVDEKAS